MPEFRFSVTSRNWKNAASRSPQIPICADPAAISAPHRIAHREHVLFYRTAAAELTTSPCIEVSTISNSVYEFSESERGHPTPPAGEKTTSNLVAQRLSNRITVDLIQHYGRQILAHNWQSSEVDPFPASAYTHPKDPGALTSACEK